MLKGIIADPAGPLSYNALRKKYSGWHVSNFEEAIKRVTRPSELDELRIAIKYFLSKEDAIKLGESVSARLNELSDRLISFGDFLMAYKNAEQAFKEMRDRCVKRGNDWVCASYMSQIDFFIHSQATDRSKGGRGPLNDMLGKVREGYELVKLLEEKWTEFKDQEQIPGFIEEEIHDIFKGLLAREIGQDRFWASMDIRSEVEGRPIITLAKKMELIELWVKHGIMLPAQKHIVKPEVTMPRAPTTPTEPVPMGQVRQIIKTDADLNKRIEELRKKKEVEKQREKERQEKEPPQHPTPAAPSPDLDLMKDEIEKRIVEMMRRRKAGEGQAGEPAARYGVKKKDLILQVTGTESRYSGSGSEWLKTPVSVSIEKDQNAHYLLYRRSIGKEVSTSYHTKTYNPIYIERYQGPFGYTVEIRFTDERNSVIKAIFDPTPNPKFINGVVLENEHRIAEFDVDQVSFIKAEQFARENGVVKEVGRGLYQVNEKIPKSPEDMFKMSYAKLHFLINTEQDTDELKRLYSLVDMLSITEFDKELLKEEISQRIQSILDAEESAKPSAPEIPDEQETCPPHEAPPGFICPKCGKFVTEYEIWKLVDFEKASITSLNIDELYELMDAVHASTLDRSDKERLVFRMRERIQILKGGPDEGFAEGAAKYASFMPYQSDELSVVETNLLNVGYTLRNDGRGHMVLPNGKGVSPTNHRGIVNHWEVIVDAGYLPSSNIFKLKHSPDAIVAGAINKGWRRWSGEASYEIRDLSKPNADFINMRLKQHFDNSGLYEAHIDVWSEGKYYNFDKKIWDKSNHDILQAIKKITPKSYQPAKAMELTLMENEYLIRDPVSIGDPDVWITSKSAAFQDDIRGAHHGQVDGTLIAYDIKARITIGYIDYSIFEGKLYLNCIEVKSSHRRQGYATALLMKLKKLNPSMVIKWGMMTEDGCALKNDIEKGIAEPRHEYTKAKRIAMAKAIAATVEKTTSESEGETCISIDNLSKLSKEERIRLAKKIAGGETEVRSTVVRDDVLDVKEKCSEWDFGTFEVMLSGAESQDELEGMLDCLNASKLLSESQIETMRKLIEKKIMEE